MVKKLMIGMMLMIFSCLVSNAYADYPPAYEGRLLFTSYCLICHGPDGKGNGPLSVKMNIKPADLTVTVRTRSDTILKKIISGAGRQTITGRDRHNLISQAMPEWENILSEQEIRSLIAYLRFISTSKHKLMGDPEMGFKLYERYCQACHGLEGEGDGIMTSLIKMEPMDHTNPATMSGLSNEELVQSIENGKGDFMPAWKGIISREKIEALVSYIRLLAN